MLIVATYVIYIAISLGVTMWVATTLHTNGRAFLIDAFKDNVTLADSINHLLVVGFYLINLGYVSWVLKLSTRPDDVASAIELLSAKIGLVLLVLGATHFGNIYVFSRIRRSSFLETALPPVQPSQQL